MKKFFILMFILTGCLTAQKPPVNPDPYTNLKFDFNYTNGLTDQERLQYYLQDEGIQYLPVDVLTSLDRPVEGGLGLYDEPFFARPERFGLYPNFLNKDLPPVLEDLPIGITVSRDKNYVPMAGINCATCHTNLITSNGKGFLVDGSSGLFAIDRLIKEMVFAMASTMVSPPEFVKFYNRYQAKANLRLGKFDLKISEDKELNEFFKSEPYQNLNSALDKHLHGKNPNLDKDLVAFMPKYLALKPGTTLGDGAYPTTEQLDSGIKVFGYFVQRVLFFYQQGNFASGPSGSTIAEAGLGRANPWSVVKNMLAAQLENKNQADWPKVSGPINTPNIWGFNRSKWIFWTGVTNSMLERNMAQGVALVTNFNWNTYETTISIKKLAQVSNYAKKITPPIWPENILGSIDKTKIDLGKVLYKNNCLSCHADSKNMDTASISYKYIDVGTDPEYYKGQVESFYGGDLFKDALAPWLKKIKLAAYKREGITNPSKYESNRMNVVWKAPVGNKLATRPLYGIWASAPYLHNGSVPSIRELLKKPADRVAEFYVGSTEYDTADLGFKSQPLYFAFNLQTKCANCTGNSNQGHDFGTSLTDAEKDQLIEFLKAYTTETEF